MFREAVFVRAIQCTEKDPLLIKIQNYFNAPVSDAESLNRLEENQKVIHKNG